MLFPHKINLFYKLAQESKSQDEQNYDLIVKDELPVTQNLWAISKWINLYGDKPYFKLDDWFSRIDEIVGQGGLWRDDIDILRQYFGKYANPTIIHLLQQHLINSKSNGRGIGVAEYLWYEKNYVPDDLLKKAQVLLIKTLMEDYQIVENGNKDTTELDEVHEQRIDNFRADLARHLGQLMDESKKFSPELLRRLTKHFGVDTYVGALNQSRGLHGVKTHNKETYTKFDIAYLFSSYLRSVNKETLWEIIKKCNDGAKQQMQKYLYQDTRWSENPDTLFMLSEDMTPMNINYQGIKWPDGILIRTLSEIRDEELQNKWAKVFQDFHIFPAT